MRPPWLPRLATATALQLVVALGVIGLFPAYSISSDPKSHYSISSEDSGSHLVAVTLAAVRAAADKQDEDRAAARLAEEQAAARLAEDNRKAEEDRGSRSGSVPQSWICPVQGPRAFTDDFGDSRGRRRRHQGNDIMAPRGTPVVASVAGTVRSHHSGLGGISYYLQGDDGNTYFGTHLDRLSGASGRVGAGTVLGFVGSSGNASASAPHLHFEVHPGGGRATNPYPMLSRHC